MARQRAAQASHSRPLELLGQETRRERADAAANRQKILAATVRLFRERGVDAVTMDEIAAAAGVGKGTLFRRFADKSGLAAALIDERERRLQARLLSGPPPLGAGAPPRARLDAFVRAYLQHLRTTLDIVRLSETATPGARYRIGSYRLWHRHIELLLDEAGASDPSYGADAILSVLAADLVSRQRADGMSWSRITAGAVWIAGAVSSGKGRAATPVR
jgi:AcrR family transcriptional regulator